ncbi:hypothetical protein HYE67_000432 [Fusarium culmorum]|uniref:Uncharacterized protein n=1 Tax=Fusarium culmorum TaxID=5516 RepID=A0A2T4GJ51_FUSCU|nr:hypothetical protein FCULG_00002040 [Fusarium culmorum]QPC58201.1 hypothetical protein HYE67_000432 [Fusarium culmorum]
MENYYLGTLELSEHSEEFSESEDDHESDDESEGDDIVSFDNTSRRITSQLDKQTDYNEGGNSYDYDVDDGYYFDEEYGGEYEYYDEEA